MELEIKNYIKGTIRSVLFEPLNENHLLSAGTNDNNVYLFDTENAEKISTLFGHKNDIFSICFKFFFC
jgi:WD40 repeat protein